MKDHPEKEENIAQIMKQYFETPGAREKNSEAQKNIIKTIQKQEKK